MRVDCFPTAPASWTRRTLNHFCVVNPRYALDRRKTYPFIEMAAVAENFGGVTRLDARPAASSGLARFRQGDVLYGKITPCTENGKIALVESLPDEYGLGSTEFIVLSPRPGYDPHFVYAVLCADEVRLRTVARMEGSTGRQRVTEDVFTKWLLVPEPPEPDRRLLAEMVQ